MKKGGTPSSPPSLDNVLVDIMALWPIFGRRFAGRLVATRGRRGRIHVVFASGVVRIWLGSAMRKSAYSLQTRLARFGRHDIFDSAMEATHSAIQTRPALAQIAIKDSYERQLPRCKQQ